MPVCAYNFIYANIKFDVSKVDFLVGFGCDDLNDVNRGALGLIVRHTKASR